MKTKLGLKEFRSKYGRDDQCLEIIKQLRYPDNSECLECKRVTRFYRVSGRTAYVCNFCGHHVYPLADTIFEKSTTPLNYWFFAMYLITQTRSGISAKQLERMLGVTYKTAWRMFKQIRLLMAQTGEPLTGTVEVDETFMGGKGKNRRYVANFNEKPKEVVMGMIQREGKAYLKHVLNTGKWTLINQIKQNVDPRAHIVTDEWRAYANLPKFGYKHSFVNHKETYVNGDVHTQNAENMWSQVKRGIYGVYRKVSKKYLQAYADEYAFRYGHRKVSGQMFDLLLAQVVNVSPVKVDRIS
jgi:transposase-like protein